MLYNSLAGLVSTKNRKIIHNLKEQHIPVYYAYSIKGILLCLRYSCTRFSDINLLEPYIETGDTVEKFSLIQIQKSKLTEKMDKKRVRKV